MQKKEFANDLHDQKKALIFFALFKLGNDTDIYMKKRLAWLYGKRFHIRNKVILF